MLRYDIGIHRFSSRPDRSYYHIEGLQMCRDAHLEYFDIKYRVKSYDSLLHQSLNQLLRSHRTSNDPIKELPREAQLKSMIKPILEQEPFVSRHFSKEELENLPLLWIAVLGCYDKSTELLLLHFGVDVNEPFGRHEPQVIDEKLSIILALLQMSSSLEKEQLVCLAIDNGADLKARDYRGQSVLHFAVASHRVRLTKVLLEKGADVNAADNEGMTPLLLAASSIKADEMLTLLMQHGADGFAKTISGENTLHRLTYYNYHLENAADLARALIARGASVNDRAKVNPETGADQPIHLAALKGADDLVELFLDYGADVNSQNEQGVFPLFYVAELYRKYKLLKMLLHRGANVNLRTVKGRTVLHAACTKAAWSEKFGEDHHSERIIRLLLSAGESVLVKDCDGNTPLTLILSRAHVNKGTFLLVKNFALKKALQPAIDLSDEIVIRQYPRLQRYYQECSDELQRMKVIRLINTCTLIELLVYNYCRIAVFMRNPNFETNFRGYDLEEFPKYGGDVLRAFERTERYHHGMEEKEDVIHEAIDYILPRLIVNKIAHYLLCCYCT